MVVSDFASSAGLRYELQSTRVPMRKVSVRAASAAIIVSAST